MKILAPALLLAACAVPALARAPVHAPASTAAAAAMAAAATASKAAARRAPPAPPPPPLNAPVVRAPDEPQVLFVKDGDIISPLATLRDGSLRDFSPPGQAGVPDAELDARYFAPGRTYYLYGGGKYGKASVLRPKKVSCDSQTAQVQAVDGMDGNGVLSNAPLGGAGPGAVTSATREPTVAEKALLARLAKQVLSRYRLPPTFMQLLVHPDNVSRRASFAALPLRDNPKPLLFAAYTMEYAMENRSGSYALTLLAEPNESGTYLVTFREVDQGEGESSGNSRKFITNADLDGDGSEELVLIATGNERWWYEVLSKVRSKWTIAAVGGGGGC